MRSSAVRFEPPSSATDWRTKARTSARWSTEAGTRIARDSRGDELTGLGEARVVRDRTLEEPARALLPGELAVPDDHRAAAHDHVRAALDRAALVARVIDGHVVGFRRDRVLPVRVVDHDVGVRPDRDGALPRVHPEQLRWRGRRDLDPALLADLPAHDATVMQQ